jgi:hypothetical protein
MNDQYNPVRNIDINSANCFEIWAGWGSERSICGKSKGGRIWGTGARYSDPQRAWRRAARGPFPIFAPPVSHEIDLCRRAPAGPNFKTMLPPRGQPAE